MSNCLANITEEEIGAIFSKITDWQKDYIIVYCVLYNYMYSY